MSKRKTTEQFIKEARLVHGDKYDYSLLNYIDSKTKVKIRCNTCGNIFEQTPGHHLSGRGCPECAGKIKKTTEQFIQESKEIHGDKFDYSLVNYVNEKTKVKIRCSTCGQVFTQTPHNHLKGKGCPNCAGKMKSTFNFIEESNLIHNFKYSYERTSYKNNTEPVEIICPIHGSFFQSPKKHLLGHGCPHCNSSHGEREIRNYLQEHNIRFEEQKRFGDCKNKYSLPFDFYLPDYNLCIEFQGEQHFKPLNHFGGENKFRYRQQNDSIKKAWCSLPDTPDLLEITYLDDIEERLYTFFL